MKTETEEVSIECGEGETAYEVILTGRSLEVFMKAAKDDRVQGLNGEALVAGLHKVIGSAIVSIERRRNGEIQDGPNGEPAYQQFYHHGALHLTRHFQNGKYHDGPNGEAAFRAFNGDGVLIRAEHFLNGKRHDSPNGDPAILVWAAPPSYDSTRLVKAERYHEDKLVHTFDLSELAAFDVSIQAAERRCDIDTIHKALPALKVLSCD